MAEERVLVIGAGLAGLAAARDLARAGVAVDVIEARSRLGGRVLTLHDPDWPLPIELGAEFVHGRPEATLALLEQAGLGLRELPDRHYWAAAASQRHGADHLPELPDLWGRMAALLRRVDRSGPDLSAQAFADRERLGATLRTEFELFVRGFHAAPLADVSVQSLAADLGGPEHASDTGQFRVDGGYGRLVGWLARELEDARDCRIHTGLRATAIRWRRGEVVVHGDASGGESGARQQRWSGRAAVITLPAGVLARAGGEGSVHFDPPLAAKREALAFIGMGRVVKVVLRFRAQWWSEEWAPKLDFFHDPSSPFLTFWREERDAAQQISAWAGDPRGDLEPLASEESAADLALTTLARRLGTDAKSARAYLVGQHRQSFDDDPYSGGAYSYLRPGAADAHARLARPLDATLYFAGEATDAEEPATVAGAIRSGQRAARELLGA